MAKKAKPKKAKKKPEPAKNAGKASRPSKSKKKPVSSKSVKKKPSKAVPKHASKKKNTNEASSSKPNKPSDVFSYVKNTMEKIQSMEIQGANDIAQAGVRALKHVAEKSPATNRKAFLEDITKAAEMIKEARPTEPALRNVINVVMHGAERYELKSIDNVRRYAIRLADQKIRELESVVETISEIGSEEIRDGDVIITHCHSEQVVGILRTAKEKRRKFTVIVTETRPHNQGLITARELADARIETIYIVDSAAATYMKRATKMLVGCDAILADGSIVNKIGTYAMALMAKQFQTPVFVAGETLKFDPLTMMGAAEPIEQRRPDEVADPKELRGVKIDNPVFDVTPADLVDAMVTEKGVMKPELVRANVESLA